jgi:adenine-specific DNA-methyltransferase
LAYTDTWEGGIDSFLDMLYPRLQLIKRLLSNTGSLYLHIDWHAGHYLKLLLDEIFGFGNFRNEIIWQKIRTTKAQTLGFGNVHDVVFVYTKTDDAFFENQYIPFDDRYIKSHYKKDENKRSYRTVSLLQRGQGPARKFGNKLLEPPGGMHWIWSQDRIDEAMSQGLIRFTSNGRPEKIQFLDDMKGDIVDDIWNDIYPINSQAKEDLDYPTQKPEALLERIIKASSKEGDLVADFFCGSGTTMAVAERLGRRWIGCNLDKVGLQVSRNRMVNQQAKPFLLENIGNYQRHMIYLSGSKIGEMQRIILKLYEAEPRSDRTDLGIRIAEDNAELVYVGYPDRPVTAKKVIELAQEAELLDGTGYKTLVILAWDYDYNFSTELESRKKALKNPLKVSIKPLTIPPDIYNYLKKAKNEDELDSLRDKIVFHEKPYLRISQPQVRDAGDHMVVISLEIERYVLMNFPIPEKQQAELRKAIKDNFAALIDYWAIDWDYDGKTFKSMWQAIRGNGRRTSTVITNADSPELPARKRAIAVRLVDVFGNDASAIVEVK